MQKVTLQREFVYDISVDMNVLAFDLRIYLWKISNVYVVVYNLPPISFLKFSILVIESEIEENLYSS